MFWVWVIIAFIWGACSGMVLVNIIFSSDINGIWQIIFTVLLIAGGLITVVTAITWGIIDDLIRKDKKIMKPVNWFWKKIQRPRKRLLMELNIRFNKVINRRKRRQDFKEMDQKEDEWNIERLGIKSK